MSSDNQRVDEALADVRRAYRLIWLYQRRVLDLINTIAEKFEQPFYYWCPAEYNRPGNSDPTLKWAWNMLPLYDTSFLYVAQDERGNLTEKGSWMLEIEICADDGFDAKMTENGEPAASKFKSAEVSASTLSMWAWYSTETKRRGWYSLWSNERLDFPESGHVKDYPELSLKILGSEFSLSEFEDENSVTKCVNSFKDLIRSKLGLDVA